MQKIAAKLVKIMQEVAYVKKNGTNTFHHYHYATSADVLEKINAALVKYNICTIVMPEIINSEDVTTSKGNLEHLVTVKMEIILLDAGSGETVTIMGIGSGQDSGDKAVMKAQTAAIKYAYLLSMAISTSDDPEAAQGGEESAHTQTIKKSDTESATKPVNLATKPNGENCMDCGAHLTKGVITVSTKKYGKPLCMKCQHKEIRSA